MLQQWPVVRSAFADGTAAARLQALWRSIGNDFGRDAIDAASDVRVSAVDLRDIPGYVITFPRPERVAEAAFAIVADTPDSPRYFVLEFGQSVIDGHAYWVLCEWNEYAHLNMGSCGDPAAEPQTALQSMVEQVIGITHQVPGS